MGTCGLGLGRLVMKPEMPSALGWLLLLNAGSCVSRVRCWQVAVGGVCVLDEGALGW